MSDADDYTDRLRANIKAAREARRWSQQDLVDALAEHGIVIAQGTLSRIESGSRTPSYPEASAMAEVFGVTLDLLGSDPEQFAGTSKWTGLQGAFDDAEEALRVAAAGYETAARELWEYASEHDVPGMSKGRARFRVQRSCLRIAADAYDVDEPWRMRYDVKLGDDDPALFLDAG